MQQNTKKKYIVVVFIIIFCQCHCFYTFSGFFNFRFQFFTVISVQNRGGWGDKSPPVKIVVPSAKKKILSWGDAKTSPPVISTAKSQMFFTGICVACG